MKKVTLIFITSVLFFSCSDINNKDISPFNFLPPESEVILNINNLNNTKEILSKNKNLSNISSSKNKILNQLNSLSKKNSNNSGLLSLTPFGKNQIAYTYIRETNTQDSISKSDIEKGEYQKNKIFIDTTLLKDVYKTILGNYIISSNEDIILENIIRDYNKANQKIDSDFYKLVKAADKNDPFNVFTMTKKLNFLDNIVSNLSFFPDSHNSWVSYDFKFSLDEVNMTGASRINDSINSKISILKNISPSEILTDRFIPNSFSSFFSFTIDDSERFIFNFKNYLKGNDISTENINFDSLNIINEINFIEDQEKFIILGINNINNLESYFELSEFDNLNNIKKINIDKGMKILINSFDQDISTNYAILIDNSLVITKSVSQIKKIINSERINDNLNSNSKYLNFKNQKSKKYSFLWVNNTNSLESIQKNSNLIESEVYPFISFSGVINQNIALLDFYFSKAKETKESKDVYTEFFLTFDNEIITDPIWLKNHTNNQYDFIFQDSENYLYYYSNKGNLYWKKKIDEKIIGDIKQIDTYKNGRLQISFRTENKFYVLDRNGKEVEKLSFKIDSGEINNPVSIFDYEKNRNYRFLFVNDNTIKMFDSNGKRVSGFKPDLFDSRIINSPTHIRIDGKDFIIVQLENNDLKILDRRGRDRIKIDEKIQFSENSIFSYLKTFTTTDNLGNLIQINMDGELLKKNLNLSIDNLIDIKNDNLVYISENNLSIKGINVKLPFGRYSKPKIFNESGDMLIGITNLDESNIYLYKDNGELLDGFPVKGNSIIDVKNSDKDDEIEILTRLDKYSIVSYEIN
ncbi:hypothetical protein N9R90_02030 [Flavobacteriaceae bacterium]|nr:hypothetical protein [Flavobacteriaceae bacterium]